MTDYSKLIADTEKEYNLPAGIIARLVKVESNGNPNAKSPVGAEGITQFMPETAKQYNVDVKDPVSSIKGTGKYLSDLNKQYNGNMRAALAHYNGGGFNAQREVTGAPTARADKVSAKNNDVNKKYVNSFSDILGQGNTFMPTTSNQTNSESTGGKLSPDEIIKMLMVAKNESAPSDTSSSDALPTSLPDPYAGTVQSASNPGNPNADAISAGSPQATNAAMDEYRKRYLSAPNIIGSTLDGFISGLGGTANSARARWKENDERDRLDTMGRQDRTLTNAKSAQDIAGTSLDQSQKSAEFAQKAPAANASAGVAKAENDPASNVSKTAQQSFLMKYMTANPELKGAALAAFAQQVMQMPKNQIDRLSGTPDDILKTQKDVAGVGRAREETKQAGQQTQIGNVAVNAAKAPPNPNVSVTTSGTNVSTAPSAAATARDVAGAGVGATQVAANADYTTKKNTVDQLRNVIASVKPYQNTPGAKLYDFINPGQRAALEQMIKDAGIPLPSADAPQNVWKNALEQADGKLLLNQQKEVARQQAIESGVKDQQFEAQWNSSAPTVYINPANGKKFAVPASELKKPETIKKLTGAGLMPLNAYQAATTFVKGQ